LLIPSAKKRYFSGMDAFSKAGGQREKKGEGGSLAVHDPWQKKELGGANWNLQSSNVERSP
jgi:hypothetical protein